LLTRARSAKRGYKKSENSLFKPQIVLLKKAKYLVGVKLADTRK